MGKYLATRMAGTLLLGIAFIASTANIAFADSSILLQPGPTDGMDRWVTNTFPNSNFTNDSWLWVAGLNSTSLYNSYVRFDLSGLPVTATKAVLYLLTASTNANATTISWGLPISTWQAGTLTWNNQPTLLSVGQTIAPPVGNWYSVDITSVYNLWRSGNSYLNYGLSLSPSTITNNADAFVSSASTNYPNYRPALVVTYTPQANDTIPKLKWPLSTSYASRYISGYKFGDPWTAGNKCSNGTTKLHAGVDYRATAGTAVYAPEDGYIRRIVDDTAHGWGFAIVLEHKNPLGNKYTTVYWHVSFAAERLK